MCFTGRVYTEVALSPSFQYGMLIIESMGPFERSVHVTSDFQCEWVSGKLLVTQIWASTDETLLP